MANPSTCTYSCNCQPGYTGQFCQTSNWIDCVWFNTLIINHFINKFKGSCDLQCLNGGVCQLVNNNPQCNCPCPYSGTICQNSKLNFLKINFMLFGIQIFFFFFSIDNNPCNSSPCLNGGGCNLNPASCTYSCNCPAGFTGPSCSIRNQWLLIKGDIIIWILTFFIF